MKQNMSDKRLSLITHIFYVFYAFYNRKDFYLFVIQLL